MDFLLISYKSCTFAREITAKDVMRILNYHISNKLLSGYLSDTQRFTPPIRFIGI